MKNIKVIFFSALLLFAMARILGYDTERYFDLKCHCSESCTHTNANLSSPEPIIEEEPTLFSNSNADERLLSSIESLPVHSCNLPVKVYYTIWLPPELC